MSNTYNSSTHHHHNNYHHESSKSIFKEMPHKLHDTPPYSDFYFNGKGFERYSNQPRTNTRVANYYDRTHNYGVIQKDEDIDAQAANFIRTRHITFELSKTMPMGG
ncbi:hypothetical protein QVD17_31556 [Tagetes erecta]|uniref:Uncharacterized protein n=1 Tax=Tagetes erecta TaxID=13708 RepID=A0AAD8NH55_TARER|nr:hypothetical protein QVD17_31556 [Tagetes erecta]